MRFVLLFLIGVFANANIDYILKLISKIESRQYHFDELKVPKVVYKEIVTKKKENKNRSINIVVEAVFNNKVLIYNKWYKVGDMYEDYKIEKITDDYIMLKSGDKVYTINIKPEIGF